MLREKDILAIGTGHADPSAKADKDVAGRQAVVNITDALKAIALILIDIRDGHKDHAQH